MVDRIKVTIEADPEDVAIQNALTMVSDIERALADGVRHYAEDGRELTTVLQIIQELSAHGAVRLENLS